MAIAPWEAAKYFFPPQFINATVGTSAGQVIGADYSRVLMIFSSPSGAITLLPQQAGLAVNAGIVIAAGTSIVLNYDWFGPLCQLAWFGIAGVSNPLSIITLSLSAFPKESKGATEQQIASIQTAIQRLGGNNSTAIVTSQP